MSAPVEPGDAGMLAIVTQLVMLITDAYAPTPREAALISSNLVWCGSHGHATRAAWAEAAAADMMHETDPHQQRALRMLAAYLMALDAIDPAPRRLEGPGAEVGP